MRIKFIKKIKADGTPCRKCADVEQRLRDAGYYEKIDEIIIADDTDRNSEGLLLARQYNIETAPFFLVEDDDGETEVYTIYFKFLKEVLQKKQ